MSGLFLAFLDTYRFEYTDRRHSWPADGLFERVNDRIKAQIERVEDMTGDMDPKTNFALIVIQTELERFKFLVRSYLRARIAKVGPSFTVLGSLPFCASC